MTLITFFLFHSFTLHQHAEFQRNLQDVCDFVRNQRGISAVQSNKRLTRSMTNDDQK